MLVSLYLAVWGPREESLVAVQSTPRLTPESSNSSPVVAVPAALPPPAGAAPPSTGAVLALVPRERLIGYSERDFKRGLFAARSWAPPAPAASAPATAQTLAAPSLPFTYLGKEQSGETWRVFLSDGDMTLVVGTADMVNTQYKVLAITPPTMTFEYLPLHEQQTLQIE